MKGATDLLRKLETSNVDQFFTIRDEKSEWLGDRSFRYNHVEGKVVHVCINPGPEHGKGKHHCIGINLLGKQTFLSNYLATNYVRLITKAEYEAKVQDCLKILLSSAVEDKNSDVYKDCLDQWEYLLNR